MVSCGKLWIFVEIRLEVISVLKSVVQYVATRGDNVIGVVTSRAGDMYRVDIGASELASISYLAFEGSTKKNRPDVKVRY